VITTSFVFFLLLSGTCFTTFLDQNKSDGGKDKIEDQQLELQMKMNRLGGKVVEMKKV